MPTTTHTAMGYRATRSEDDSLVIHRVPIFCACERGDVQFDDVWIKKAVAKAKQSEREGYYPPLHIRHHEAATEANDSVRAAGYFRILGAEPITFKGARRIAIMADLIITDPAVQEEVLAKRLPYRSVEIFNVEEPSIDGLALLDHEAPFLELPMLMVSEVSEDGVPGGTFRDGWQVDAHVTDGPVVACFRRGNRATLLFREDNDMIPTKAPEATIEPKPEPKATQPVLFADDDAPKKDDDKDDDGENLEAEALDVSAIVKAIGDGSITVADMDAILVAIQSQKTESAPEEEQENPTAPAPAAAPGAEAMKATPMTAKFAAMQGKIEGLEARDKARDETDACKSDVDTAMQRLEGIPLGADLRERLVTFRKDHGAPAFEPYVKALAQSIGPLPDEDDTTRFMGGKKLPEVAMKYQDQGTEAVERAAKFVTQWENLRTRGLSTTLENYVALNMNTTEEIGA